MLLDKHGRINCRTDVLDCQSDVPSSAAAVTAAPVTQCARNVQVCGQLCSLVKITKEPDLV